MKVWIDGAIVDGPEARIPVTDHGFLYGDGVFEGLRIYGGRVFRLRDHLRRLQTGCRSVGLAIPGGLDGLEEIVLATARAHGAAEAYVRLVVTRGEGPLGVDPLTCPSPRVLCIVDDIQLYPPEKVARGVDMVTVSLRKPASDVLDPRVKSLNYLNSVLAKREARLRGADEALVLNGRGHVAEAAVANVFAVRDGRMFTPPANDGALEGVTRRTVLELAPRLGLPAEEKTLSRFDLLGADEVFLTGTGARVMPVATLDGEAIGDGARPVTGRVANAFAAVTEELGTPFAPGGPSASSGQSRMPETRPLTK